MHAARTRGPTLFAALAAAALALAACSSSSSGPTPPACKGVDQACGTGTECCSADCPSGACGCSAVGERCGTSGDCCTSLGPTRCEAGACVSGQRPLGDVCDWDGLCASLNCDLTGHCAAACLGYNASCSASAQCCSYLGCPAGTCTPACASSGSCSGDNQCCSDYRCRAGACQHGVCGTAGQTCASGADCCTAAQGGKNYFCNPGGQCDLGAPGGYPGAPPEACATDADCAGSYPCRGGYCHWPDGTQPDGRWCLDGQECDGGSCTSTAAGVPGTCCSGAGAGCVAGGYGTVCCAPHTCTGASGAQSCGACLDYTNSGPQGTAETQCVTPSQCCAGRNLTCVSGECCSTRGVACGADSECCAGAACGDVTTYAGTTPSICCGDFGGSCGYANPCCDGLLCANDGTCRLAPGGACTETAQCADYEGCKIETPPTGFCCSHELGDCTSDADCCSGSCDVAYGRCNYAQEYGQCLDDSDCLSRVSGRWSGPVCGGNVNVGPFLCCPVPGDSCGSAADCCETGDSCRPPLSGTDPVTPVCCREVQAACGHDYECCTGICDSTYTHQCCAFPYMTTFTCTSSADCCDGTGTYARTQCGDAAGAMRCCLKSAQNPYGTAADCCSGRLDQLGLCR